MHVCACVSIRVHASSAHTCHGSCSVFPKSQEMPNSVCVCVCACVCEMLIFKLTSAPSMFWLEGLAFVSCCCCVCVVLSNTVTKLRYNLLILSVSLLMPSVCAALLQERPKRKPNPYKMSTKQGLSTTVPLQQTPLTAPDWNWFPQVSKALVLTVITDSLCRYS